MNKKLTFFSFFITLCFSAFATHNRAGEITYRVLGYLQFEATITTYTKASSVPADRDTLNLDWGDGIIDKVLRVNGPLGGQFGLPNGEILPNDIKKNIYIGRHTYSGPLPYYVISVTDPNRIDNIININGGASVNIQFYIEDTLKIFDPVYVGVNNSPILYNEPIDYANINDTFYHNPNAYDPDGDSLGYQLIIPFQAVGFNVPNYKYPQDVNASLNDDFTINAKTGEIIWATPKQVGIYNIAILITEYRNKIKMGTVLRDMEIIVEAANNDPPQIAEIHDTCIIAGSLLSFQVTATDPNTNQRVTLSGEGGPFHVTSSPATFPAVSGLGGATGTFEWQTNCTHIRRQFYEVVFKAEDNYVIPLVDLETWLINVVAPPPENLVADAIGNQVNLSWDSPYTCDKAATSTFIGFSVWRREGSNPFVPGTCDIGLAGKGYTKIAERLDSTYYTDINVTRGTQYCYRVLAEFAEQTPFGLLYNKVESIPSNEACSELSRDVPVIKNVSVVTTDSMNGKMYIAWYKPVAGLEDLDTNVFRPPYYYKLYQATGFPGGNMTEIYTFPTAASFAALNDTSFVDSTLNTVRQPYSYRLDFYSNGNQLVGSTEDASSVFLTVASGSNKLNLSWEEDVPWTNNEYEVYRYNFANAGYDFIGTTTEQSYTDKGLINDSLYCYRILSIGSYSDSSLMTDVLYNYSQMACERPADKVPPCPPILSVSNDCDELAVSESCIPNPDFTFKFENRLTWTDSIGGECVNDIHYYKVYYSPNCTDMPQLVDSVFVPVSQPYIHVLGSSLAGSYAVTAVDSNGNESGFSNVVCKDNCPCYKLPNVFTPNNDNHNDYYTPFKPYRFVDHIDIKIFNRWGDLVFQTSDPEIHWNGNDFKSNKPLKEGVYYYTCTVFEQTSEGVKKNEDILSGYIHLIRGNGGVIE